MATTNPLQATASTIAPAVNATASTIAPAQQVTAKTAGVTDANLDQQNGLVQNQITKIIDQNSPLMQRAAARANEQMASRGMLNSSLAVGNAQNAVLANALPIAQSDAAATNQFALTNAQEANTTARYNVGQENSVDVSNAQLATDVNKANATLQTDVSKTNATAANDINAKNATLQTDISKANASLQADQARATNDLAVKYAGQMNSEIAQIMQNNTMSSEAKNAAINDLKARYAPTIQAFEALGASGVPGLLNFGAESADIRASAEAAKRNAFLASPDSMNDKASTYYSSRGYNWNGSQWVKQQTSSSRIGRSRYDN